MVLTFSMVSDASTSRVMVFQLLAGENQALLIRGNAFLVLDLGLDILDGVRCLHVESNGLACQRLYENLHATTQTQNQVERRLFLDVVVRESVTVFQLLASENQALLIRGNAFLVLDLSLDILDGVRGLHVESDGLACQRLYENLHATTQAQNQVERRLFLDVVVRESSTVF